MSEVKEEMVSVYVGRTETVSEYNMYSAHIPASIAKQGKQAVADYINEGRAEMEFEKTKYSECTEGEMVDVDDISIEN